MSTCIEQLAPILSQAEQHPEHGGVMANGAIASFFEVDAGSIRTLKKRLTDEQAITEGKHWLKGSNNKTLWTVRGFIRLGMRLSSVKALELQAGIEELLTLLNAGQIEIRPVEGQAVGVQLVTVETTETAISPVVMPTDETALGRALGAAKYAQEQQAKSETVRRIADAAMAHYLELKQGEGEQPMGEALAQKLGLPTEIVTNAIQGAV